MIRRKACGKAMMSGRNTALVSMWRMRRSAQQPKRQRPAFGAAIKAKGFGPITTEILDAPPFYYAEAYHQQYLAKNPDGYCGLGGTGVSCPIGTGVASGIIPLRPSMMIFYLHYDH